MFQRNQGRRPWQRWLASVAATALAATSFVAIDTTINATEAQAAAPLSCDGSTVYSVDVNGLVEEFDVNSGNFTQSAVVSGQQNNALGISGDGRYLYTLQNSSGTGNKQMVVHDRVEETSRTISIPGVPEIIRGAVNPVNGYFYFGGYGTSPYLGVYKPDTGESFRVGTIPNLGTDNGDFALLRTASSSS